MAARNDQTMQIVVIILSILTVLFGGFTYYFWKQYSDTVIAKTAVETQKNEESNRANTLQTELQTYRTYMGFGELDNTDTVKAGFEEDMKIHGATLGDAQKNYRIILSTVSKENEKNARLVTEGKQRETDLRDQLASTVAQTGAKLKEYETKIANLETDSAAERNKFNSARADLENKQQELVTTLNSQRDTFEKQVTESTTKTTELETQLSNSERSREKLLAEREQQAESFEVADGRITWVNQANQTVWINLGESDSLRRQVTFSVFQPRTTDAGKASKKGSIEVTRLLGDHMAEARISSDDVHNPILPGDQIYSPLWHRGRKIHFALTGLVDLNGDGKNDLQQAKDLIALNGGTVDSSIGDDGKVEGEMSIDTRYLVLGDYPENPSQASMREGYDRMTAQADNLGVETITLEDFMNQMGYRSQDRTVQLGDKAKASDFTPNPNNSNPQFRPRSSYFRF